ncbi:uncharacterized protein LOC122404826 isoform X1 [Colletes gigas]|uniref:uncharacterized protein LOC122404826 isoform X1 n=1 Tax=Colletes gigas TaxID=935657 RepID=UPI001C9B8A45|nr:uncharacterized protein LOC122404826 isoform X1 [Colletes gigas]
MMNVMIQSWFIGGLFLLGCVQECWQLVIKNVDVPKTVKVGEADHVILDCDYDFENTPTKGLVVKWFFNVNELAYQWIYGRNPLAGELMEKYVDLKYEASDDPYTKYRAMKLNKPGIDLTGDYRCVISTFADERSANASMVVYSTEEKFDLVYRKRTIDDKDGVEISCMAEGLYPQPTLDISIEGVPEKQTARPTVTLRDDGLYDILSRTALLDEDLPEAAIVKCLLGIPKANYNVSHQTVYYPGTPTTTSTATTKLLQKMENQALDNSEAGNGGGNYAGRMSINVLLVMMMHLALVNIFN